MSVPDGIQAATLRVPEKRNRTADALLEASITMLSERGEAGFRVEDVLQACDASPSSLYHHFGSRDGLIEAATLEAYRRTTEHDLAVVRTAFGEASDPADLLARLRAMAELTRQPDRSVLRLERLRLLGASVTRPVLRQRLGEDIDGVTDELVSLFENAQRRNLIRPELDPRALAMFIQSFVFGFVLDDVAGDGVSSEGWAGVIDNFNAGIVTKG